MRPHEVSAASAHRLRSCPPVRGNLESDLQAGAYTGYQLAWVLLLATAVGLLLQILACRLGVVSGRHLAEVCKAEYPRRTVLALWAMTELAIIGSDIQEVVGSAIAFKLLFGLELWIGVLITGCDTFTFLLLHYLGIRKLEAFFAALIATMSVCFFINFGAAAPSAKDIAGVRRADTAVLQLLLSRPCSHTPLHPAARHNRASSPTSTRTPRSRPWASSAQ